LSGDDSIKKGIEGETLDLFNGEIQQMLVGADFRELREYFCVKLSR
jgi:hypothetical protein